jgi:hypothetical protein
MDSKQLTDNPALKRKYDEFADRLREVFQQPSAD